MADLKISQLSAATTPLTGDELVPIVQGGSTKKTLASSLQSGPAFSVYGSATQALANAAFTKITFDVEEFDTNGNFASSRFTPTVAGYYQLSGSISINGVLNTRVISIYKNGVEFKRCVMMGGYSAIGSTTYSFSALVQANGSTDYFEVYVYQDSGTTQNTNAGQANVFFMGSLVRSA